MRSFLLSILAFVCMAVDDANLLDLPAINTPAGTEQVPVDSSGGKRLSTAALVGKTPFTATGGTAARTAADRWSDEVDAMGFVGIDPTGSTDSLSAIQAAIDRAYTLGGEVGYPGFKTQGCVVNLPKGEFALSAPLVVKKGVSLKGKGRSGTRIFPLAGFVGAELIQLGDPTVLGNPQFGSRLIGINVSCKNIVQKGVYSVNVQEGGGVFDCLVTEFTKYGIHWKKIDDATYCSLAVIDHCEIWAGNGAEKCVYMEGAYNCRVQNSTVLSVGTPSAIFHGVHGVFTNLRVYCLHYENMDSGVYFGDTCSGQAQNIEGGNCVSRPSGLGGAGVRIDSQSGAVTVANVYNYDSMASLVGESLNDAQNGRAIDGPVNFYAKGRYSVPGEGAVTVAGRLDIAGPENVDLLAVNDVSFIQYINGLSGIKTAARQRRFTNAAGVDLWTIGAYSPSSGDGLSLKLSYLDGGWSDYFIFRSDGWIELMTAGKGIIMRSPNGTAYKVTVNDAGAVVTAPL